MLNQRGQVAIFIALVFNVLFVFFAMVINVGLLVHHKINLQNSVDLAAYYGASKQAEGLNVIAHANYQIRQSWKLLAYRYITIGSLGLDTHPSKVENIASDDQDRNFETDPIFCTTYRPLWEDTAEGENTCRKVEGAKITRIGVPDFVGPLVLAGFIRSVIDAAKKANESQIKRCQQIGVFNFISLARNYYSFVMDQANLKSLIYYMANNLSNEQKDEFFDIEGKSVRLGIEKTLRKNLTADNAEAITELKVYNGLSGCGQASRDTEAPKWLSEVKVLPGFVYADWQCSASSAALSLEAKSVTQGPNYAQEEGQGQLVDRLLQFTNMRLEGLYQPSIGVEKNPWCMAYVGVSATTKPKIPFSPFGAVELKAKAFAKPFGGSIGPWYSDQWPSGSDRSTGKKLSELFPPRLDGSNQIGDPNDPSRLANYSRYVGDKVGLRSRLTHKHFAKNLTKRPDGIKGKYAHFNHLLDSIDETNSPGDVLAWDSQARRASPLREYEIGAIAPDIFDVTYYSIDANFGEYYLPKLREGFQQKVNFKIRGDLGYRDDVDDLKKFSVRNQIELVAKNELFDMRSKLTYYIDSFAKLLTSWVTVRMDDFSMEAAEESFSRCSAEDLEEVPIPGGCQKGGRSGYSVKLVSESMLRQNSLRMGGLNAGGGPILNPPPEDF